MQVIMQEQTWNDVREDVTKVNPELAHIIDNLAPDNSYILYRLKYPFGKMIFNNGIVNIANRFHQLASIKDYSVLDTVKKNLTYRIIPMGLVLDKSIEIYIETMARVIPLTIVRPGQLFGVWETFDPPKSYFNRTAWTITSGGRSLFFLQNISEASKFKKIKKMFGLRAPIPKSFKDHWQTLIKIYQSPYFKTEWESDILFFTKKWQERLNTKNDWITLQNYLYKVCWEQSRFWRLASMWTFIWQQFAQELKAKNIAYSPYQLETVKHIITCGVGALPIFKPLDQSNDLAPVTAFKEIFAKQYESNYFPTLMGTFHFSMHVPNTFGYYSINEPSLIEGAPRGREITNVMQFTREVKELYQYFKELVLNNKLAVENTPICEFVKKTDVNFFHTSPDAFGQLHMPTFIPKDNPAMCLPKKYNNLHFCTSSAFLRGCIRLATNNKL